MSEKKEVETAEAKAFEVPSGKFRNGLCGCFDSCCGIFFMGWCCSTCLLGQIINRSNFSIFGCPRDSPQGRPNACIIFLVATVIIGIISGVLFGIYGVNEETNTGIGSIPLDIFYLIMFIIAIVTRYNFRKKYKIDPICCCGDNCCDDCLTTWCCSCCSLIQMASHTHDKNEYSYNACSKSGLGPDAPEIV